MKVRHPVFSLIKEYEKTFVQLQIDPQNSEYRIVY